MPESILNSYTKTRGAGSHAEIYALNEALWAREKAGIAANLDDLFLSGGVKIWKEQPLMRQ